MLIYKIAPVLLLALLARADKKIELQDIEEDNLKSEKEKDYDKNEVHPTSQNINALDFFKNGLIKYFEGHPPPQSQPRYVHQYAVTEAPEKPPAHPPRPSYTAPSGPGAQQAMVGYLSNVPMQIYLVPQYYNEHAEPASSASPQFPSPPPRAYTAPEAAAAAQTQTNYIDVPAYVTPTGKAYLQPMPQYTQQFAYVTYPQPTVATVAQNSPHMYVTSPGASGPGLQHPLLQYQMPVQYQYQTALVSPPSYHKQYYQHQQLTDSSLNTLEEAPENEIESPKEYAAQTEAPYKSPEYPRYYSSRAPLRDDHRLGHVQDLPPPNPLLLRGPPPHLAHLPKALPFYRPLNKPVYSAGASTISNAITPRPVDGYGPPFRKRPTSLLDSYIPSGLQVEYLKRGYAKDPSALYDALSSGRPFPAPRHFERGFVPNQVFQTPTGGVTFAHYKRASNKHPQT
ncbi:extensin-2 [Plutella xylostella]|uniref:extensin-2 n=1 Tax=Plutella xylostella TaxID=51655 RepID=UPI002032DD5F|nr:extensin-2 [Plutella xylostella]